MTDENSRFRKLVKKYRNYFGLSQESIATLFNGKRSDYEGVETGKRTIDLNLAGKIAGVFGMSYCQMIDPNQEIPSFEQLPATTKQHITKRTEAGLSSKDYDKDIAGNLDRIIYETTALHNPITAEEIRLKFPLSIRNTIKAGRVTDLLNKTGRDEIVVKVGKRGKEYLFQLKEFAEKK